MTILWYHMKLRTTISATSTAPFIVADCLAQDVARVHRLLRRANLDGITSWEGPMRSPASTSDAPRMCLRGYLADHITTQLDRTLLLREVRSTPGVRGTVLGFSILATDVDAMVADIGSPHAVGVVDDLVEELLLLAPNKALVRTESTKQIWQTRLTDMAGREPGAAIQRLRWRQTHPIQKGRGWVKPTLLDRDIRSAQLRSRARRSDLQSTVVVTLHGSLGHRPGELLQAKMAAIADQKRTQLYQAARDRAIQPLQWAEVREAKERWTGSVRVHLGNEQLAMAFALKVRTFAVEVAGAVTPLDVHSPHLPDWVATTRQRDDDMGFRMPRGRPPAN